MNVYDYLIQLHVINSMKNRVKTKGAKEAIALADEISDEILFHQRVKRNGTKMMEPVDYVEYTHADSC